MKPKTNAAIINGHIQNVKQLDAMLEAQLDEVRAVVDQVQSGRTKLAESLDIRLSEVSRYLAKPAGRTPSGRMLLGMQRFVARHRKRKRVSDLQMAVDETQTKLAKKPKERAVTRKARETGAASR